MKLYNFTPAANALRVEMFLSEKNIKLETVQVNVREDEIFKEPYNTMNPFNCVPFLELDDGTVISETISICRYLESIYPTPSLFGKNSKDEAIIDMWNRRIELDGFLPLLHSVRNKTSFFAGKVIPGTRNKMKQSPELVIRGIEMFKILLNRIEPHLEHNQFISGERFSIADITGHFMLYLSKILKIDLKKEYVNVFRWQVELEKRTSNPINNLM
ncbi:glutathione S-transferase family protein [Alphaproteobacteria bacterium]|jgi:glutathione S-transferase|nr:glutathione S-transferase family protein [Alphaproteobacteria bacterium]